MEKYNQDKFLKIINIIKLILSKLMHKILIVLKGRGVSQLAASQYIKKITIMEINLFKIKITYDLKNLLVIDGRKMIDILRKNKKLEMVQNILSNQPLNKK